ncbi:MAG TPA: PilZ domain-containing protein [Myxococcota bacterium]|nr:PilZ domain-containing protein [Myxococcota bacterium]
MRRRFIPELDRRETRRIKQRIPCEVMVNGGRHSGVVQNLSAQGLFVEIHAALALGTAAVVAFHTTAGERFVLEASVPNRRHIPHSLKLLAAGGVGLRLVAPPEAYRRWVEDASAS